MATHRHLTLATISTSICIGLLTGCEFGKKATTPPPPKPPELTAYAPKKDGEWLNVDDVWKVKENASLQFKKLGSWIGGSWFRVVSMRKGGWFLRPADTIYNAVDFENGVNPSIAYSCSDQVFDINFGTAMNSIVDNNKETAHYTFRFDGKKHFSELAYQANPRKTKGVNPAIGKFQKNPKDVPETYQLSPKGWKHLGEIGQQNPWSNLYTARIIELSAVDKPDDIKEGVYARWNLPKSPKEMKASGELDRACKALLGADYITIGMVDQQVKAEKKAEEQKAKQEQAQKKKESEAKADGTTEKKQ